MFGFDDLLNLATTQVSHEADQNRSHSDMMETQAFNALSADQAYQRQQALATTAYERSTDAATTAYNRQNEFAGTAYQRTVNDLKAAGINPMLAIMKGPTSAPGIDMAQTPTPSAPMASAHANTSYGGGPGSQPASATMVALSQAKLLDAQARNVDADTENKPITGAHLRQQIDESIALADKYRQDTKTGVATAANIEADTVNRKETLTQIRSTIQNLTAHSELMRSQGKEVDQRVKEGIPRLEAILLNLDRIEKEMAQPGHAAREAAHDSFIGQLGAYLNTIIPLNSIIGTVPLGRAPANINKTYNIRK